MNPIYNEILGILGDVLFKHEYVLPADVDVDALFQEALIQSVFPIVYNYVRGDEKLIVSERWEKKFLQIMRNNFRVLYEHSELLEVMGKIPFTTFKGAQSAFYYPDPIIRTMGDVDFIVEEEDRDKVKGIIENAGFQWNNDNEHKVHMAFHRKPNSVWEMHWQIPGIPEGDNGRNVREESKDIIDKARVVEIKGMPCKMADEFHHCLVMLTHTAHHMINTGVGLRHICDWSVFANKVDVTQWKEQLDGCGLWRFAQILTQVSVRYLYMPQQEWAMEDVDEAILKAFIADVFESGNFGKKDSGRINQAKLMTDSELGGVDNTPMLVRLYREVNSKAKVAVPACRNNILLRPFAWGYVLVRHTMRVKKGERPKLDVKSMVQGAEKRRVLYQEFRLYERKR